MLSEPLREDEGEDEVTQQGDGHDQADDVLGGHSFVTPRATRATSANAAMMAMTKATSAIVNSWMRFETRSDPYREPAIRPDSMPLNSPHTERPTALTHLLRRAAPHPAVDHEVRGTGHSFGQLLPDVFDDDAGRRGGPGEVGRLVDDSEGVRASVPVTTSRRRARAAGWETIRPTAGSGTAVSTSSVFVMVNRSYGRLRKGSDQAAADNATASGRPCPLRGRPRARPSAAPAVRHSSGRLRTSPGT